MPYAPTIDGTVCLLGIRPFYTAAYTLFACSPLPHGKYDVAPLCLEAGIVRADHILVGYARLGLYDQQRIFRQLAEIQRKIIITG